jgi:hypothetical protein
VTQQAGSPREGAACVVDLVSTLVTVCEYVGGLWFALVR